MPADIYHFPTGHHINVGGDDRPDFVTFDVHTDHGTATVILEHNETAAWFELDDDRSDIIHVATDKRPGFVVPVHRTGTVHVELTDDVDSAGYAIHRTGSAVVIDHVAGDGHDIVG